MSQQTGRITIKWDGKALRSKPGASLQVGGTQRTGDMTDQGEFYFQEKLTPATVKATMPHMADTDLPALRNIRNATITFNADTGRVYTVAKACFTEFGDLSNGEIDVTFMGQQVR